MLDAFELPFEADSRHARALIAGQTGDANGLPLAALYLTDADPQGLGTLWAWRADLSEPIQLGPHADLDTVFLQAPGGDWAGVAHINYQTIGDYDAYDWLHFNWNGTTEVTAEHVVHDPASGELLVNFDGVAGDLAQFDGNTLRVVAQGVPPNSGPSGSYVGERHYARLDHFDGTSGRLRLGSDAVDPSSWDVVASGVQPDSAHFTWFMPALLFLENWDGDAKTGSLVAYNYDLDARTTIAEGVSSFDLTSYPWDGVVYSVPKGKKRGIWFAKAK
jgi:hypothetical protein